jgi:hypothetical protein
VAQDRRLLAIAAEHLGVPAIPFRATVFDKSAHEVAALAQEIAPVDCCVDAGGVVVMRPLIVHASSKTCRTARGACCTSSTPGRWTLALDCGSRSSRLN